MNVVPVVGTAQFNKNKLKQWATIKINCYTEINVQEQEHGVQMEKQCSFTYRLNGKYYQLKTIYYSVNKCKWKA